jgi:tetratricopeptide (TPR) repeat protein
LFTPQRLFGEVWSPPNTLSYEPFLERARIQREQDRDASARLALGGYVMARLVDKLLSLGSDADSLEGFRWQLDAVRRHVGELPGDSPETAHLAGVVEAVPPQGRPTSSLWKSLTAYAYFLEHEGRLEEALDVIVLAARSQGAKTSPNDFAVYAFFAARLNRLLARWDTASTFYSSAEEAATSVGDHVYALRCQLGRGAVHRGQGNYPRAYDAAATVLQAATELGLADVQAMACADLGVIYSLQGRTLESLEAHYRAFRLSTDQLVQMRTLGDLAIGLFQIGAYDPARLGFQIVANSDAKLLVRVNAMLELMDLESTVGNRVAFERCRAFAEEYRDRMSPSMSCDYHYKLGIGFARFGKGARSKKILLAGLAAAEQHGLNAWYFKLEAALQELSSRGEQHGPSYAISELSEAPVVQAMTEGLREYAAVVAG